MMVDTNPTSKSKPSSSVHLWGPWCIGPVFLALAGWFLWGPNLANVPQKVPVIIAPDQISTAPRRIPLTDPPMIKIADFKRRCMDCHKLFTTPKQQTSVNRVQHKQIAMNHGRNNECLKCHDTKNRDRLTLLSGQTLLFKQSPQLCAQCHGPTYRDWIKGMHGRTNGYWDKKAGKQVRLTCVQCHDPHSPGYPTYQPLPGPDTLRMGNFDHVHKATEQLDPLRQWQPRHSATHMSSKDISHETHK